MDNQTMTKIVDAAANLVHEPYIKATITNMQGSGLTIKTEYNCNNKREAAAMIASLAAELIESRADLNALTTLIKKQVKYERKN